MYENVSVYSSNVCIEYLNVDDYKDGLTHDFTLKLNVPFCDLLALQAFAEFPNQEVGQLAFKGYFNHKGMVYTFINPSTVKDYKEVLRVSRLKLMLLTHPPIRTMIRSLFRLVSPQMVSMTDSMSHPPTKLQVVRQQ